MQKFFKRLAMGILVVSMLTALLFELNACRIKTSPSLAEITRIGPLYSDIVSGPVTWLAHGPTGNRVGWCEMSLAEFTQLTQKPGLECTWVQYAVADSQVHFPTSFPFPAEHTAFTVLGWVGPVERGTHLTGHFFPDESGRSGRFFFVFG